jgi:ribosomal protein L32
MQRTESKEKKKQERRHLNAVATTLDVESFCGDEL